MARRFEEPVEKICDECGQPFKPKYPSRQKFCPGSKCRTAHFKKENRVEDKEAFAQAAIRAYWRRTKKAWRASKKADV